MFCSECGTKYEKSTSKFCSNCGTAKAATESPTPDNTELAFKSWAKKFKPTENGVVLENEAFGGIFYPTYGPAKTEVMEADLEKVWSLISTGPLKPAQLKSGRYQGSDTVGYFITEVSFPIKDDLEIELDETTLFVGNVPLILDAKSKKLRPAKYELPASGDGFSGSVEDLDSSEESTATELYKNFEKWSEKYQAQFFYYVENGTYESLGQCDDQVLELLDPRYFWTCEERTDFKDGSVHLLQPGLYEETYASSVIICNRPHEFSADEFFHVWIVASLIDSFCENCDARADDYWAEECEYCGSDQMLDFGEPLAMTFQDVPGAILRVNIQLPEPVLEKSEFRRSVSIEYGLTSDSSTLLFLLPIREVVQDESFYRANQVTEALRKIAANPDGYLFPKPHVLRKERIQNLLQNFWMPKESKIETCTSCGHGNQASVAVCWNCCAELQSGHSGELFALVSMTRPQSEFDFDDMDTGDAERLAQMVDINYVSPNLKPAVVGGKNSLEFSPETDPNARAKELHLLAQKEELDAEAVKLLVAQHLFCFGSNSCEICESLSKLKLQGMQSIFEWVIALESTDETIMSLMLLFAHRLGALETSLVLAAENPSLGKNLKDYFLDVENLTHWATRGIDAAFEELYATFEENPAFTKTELKKFNQDYESL